MQYTVFVTCIRHVKPEKNKDLRPRANTVPTRKRNLPQKISINNGYQSLHLEKTDKASPASFVSKKAIALLHASRAAEEFEIRPTRIDTFPLDF